MLFFSTFIRTIKQTLRSPTRISLIIGFPIGFTLVFAFIFGGESIVRGDSTLSIGVINQDDGEYVTIGNWGEDFTKYSKTWFRNVTQNPFFIGYGQLFINSLKGETPLRITNETFRITTFSTVKEAKLAVQSRAITLALRIPNNFSYGILSGINSHEKIINGIPLVNDPEIQNVNITIELIGDPSYLAFQTTQTEIESAMKAFKSTFYSVDLAAGNFETDFQNVISYELTQFDYFISGFLTFGLVLSSSSIAGILGDEREYRTLDRLKISNMHPIELLGGVSLTQIGTGGVQLAIMMSTAYLLGFRGQGNPFNAFVVAMITILPILGLGFFVSAFVPNGRDATGVIAMLSAPIGFVSGAFLPVPEIPLIPDIIPTASGSLRALQLWDFFPFYSSTTAIRNILLFDHNLNQVIPELIFLVTSGFIFFIFGTILFVWRVFKPEK
ncbi:MAG: ABC transporter permease [Candidatus Hodarchaeota archaeon]